MGILITSIIKRKNLKRKRVRINEDEQVLRSSNTDEDQAQLFSAPPGTQLRRRFARRWLRRPDGSIDRQSSINWNGGLYSPRLDTQDSIDDGDRNIRTLEAEADLIRRRLGQRHNISIDLDDVSPQITSRERFSYDTHALEYDSRRRATNRNRRQRERNTVMIPQLGPTQSLDDEPTNNYTNTSSILHVRDGDDNNDNDNNDNNNGNNGDNQNRNNINNIPTSSISANEFLAGSPSFSTYSQGPLRLQRLLTTSTSSSSNSEARSPPISTEQGQISNEQELDHSSSSVSARRTRSGRNQNRHAIVTSVDDEDGPDGIQLWTVR